MKRWIFCLLPLLLLLSSCTPVGTDVWYDGRELSAEEIEELLERGRETEVREMPSALVAFGVDMDAPTEESVFWTKSGGVFHLDPFCQHLSKAKEIYYGTAADAASQGKERVCTACEKEQ